MREGHDGEDFVLWCWRLECIDMGTAVLPWEQRDERKPFTVQSSALSHQCSFVSPTVSQKMAVGDAVLGGQMILNMNLQSIFFVLLQNLQLLCWGLWRAHPCLQLFMDLQSTYTKQNSFSRRNWEQITTDHRAVQWKTLEFGSGSN